MNLGQLQLTKTPLAWLLLSVFAVVIPHARHLSVWVLLAVIGVIVWRVQIYRGRWSIPKRWTKLLLVVGCILGLQFLYSSLLALEPMVALLIVSVVLKLLEMYRQKDATAVVLLCFFTTAAQFLFGQTVLDFIYGFFCSLLLLATLVALNRNGAKKSQNSFAVAIKLALQSLPIMLILFLFFPRIGSLWTVPMPQNTGKTGISGSISPGDISNLARDGGKAFVATFESQTPKNQDLYWRGLVMSDFDGRKWSVNRWSSLPSTSIVKWNGQASDSRALDWYSQSSMESDPIQYQIIMEPTQQQWLYALPLANVKSDTSGITRDFTVITQTPIAKRSIYDIQSSLQYRLEPSSLPDWFRNRNLALPDGYNPLTLQLAEQWVNRGDSPHELISNFLALIAKDFTYTLEPSLLGKNSVDEFLFNTKQGYCEHYASAFVVFMRAAGIPARIVAGYQGGEKIEDFVQVTQADAHAWAEVWLRGQGWIRVDPTAAIAPERVRDGVRAVFDRSVSNPLSMEAYRHIDFINQLRLQIDVFNYRWQKFVLNYNSKEQLSLLEKLVGNNSLWAFVIFVAGFTVLSLFTLVLYLQFKSRPRPLATHIKLIKTFEKKWIPLGESRATGETVSAFVKRMATKSPEHRHELEKIALYFEKVTYQNRAEYLEKLQSSIKNLKLK